jgi:putative peptidoglycan lipid II flippase
LHDTRTPLRIALLRVALSSVLGYVFALHLPGALGIAPRWGAAALTLSSGLVGWIEFMLLRAQLNARVGPTGLAPRFVLSLWCAAIVSGVLAFGLKWLAVGLHRILLAVLVLGAYGVLYLALTRALKIPESQALVQRVRRLVS